MVANVSYRELRESKATRAFIRGFPKCLRRWRATQCDDFPPRRRCN